MKRCFCKGIAFVLAVGLACVPAFADAQFSAQATGEFDLQPSQVPSGVFEYNYNYGGYNYNYNNGGISWGFNNYLSAYPGIGSQTNASGFAPFNPSYAGRAGNASSSASSHNGIFFYNYSGADITLTVSGNDSGFANSSASGNPANSSFAYSGDYVDIVSSTNGNVDDYVVSHGVGSSATSLTLASDASYSNTFSFNIDLANDSSTYVTLVTYSGGTATYFAPEPSSFALLVLGGIGLAFGAYRRRRIGAV